MIEGKSYSQEMHEPPDLEFSAAGDHKGVPSGSVILSKIELLEENQAKLFDVVIAQSTIIEKRPPLSKSIVVHFPIQALFELTTRSSRELQSESWEWRRRSRITDIEWIAAAS